MPVGPPDALETAPDDDPVMLAVLGNGGRRGWPLSAEDERLLDDWAGGGLAADGPAAAAAATLARDNALAAERLLERRLLALAARAPAPPPIALPAAAAMSHGAAVPHGAAMPAAPARRPSPWRWPMLTGGLVLASMLAVASLPTLREAMRGDPPLQLALVSIADRSALFEPSDIRLRGGERAPVPPSERRFRDIEVPAAALKSLFAEARRPSATVTRDIEALLPLGPRREPARVLVDAALRARADAAAVDARLAVRLYDLDDPRAVDLRAALGLAPGAGPRLYLLAARP